MTIVRRFTCELTGDKCMICLGNDGEQYCMYDLDS